MNLPELLQKIEELSTKAEAGPWVFDTYGASAFVFTKGAEEAVCDLDYEADNSETEDARRELVRANARWICLSRTAMPLLAKALQQAMEALQAIDQQKCGRADLHAWEALDRIQPLIAEGMKEEE